MNLKFLPQGKLPYLAAAGLIFALIVALNRQGTKQNMPLITPPQSPYNKSIAGIGVIEPKGETINIGVDIPGIVRTINVKVNDQVKKGDILFSLDQRDIDAEINLLTERAETAKIQALDAKAQFDIINAIADKRARAEDEFNKRKFNYQLAKIREQEALAALAQAKTTKERLTITAPVAGKILQVNIRLGEYAYSSNNTNPLMRLGDISTYYVRVEFDEEFIPFIRPQDSVVGFLRGSPQDKFSLGFVRFEPFVKQKGNLVNSGQRVDTRILEVLYKINPTSLPVFVGQQMDVFVNAKK